MAVNAAAEAFRAVENGDEGAVAEYIKQGGDCSAANEDGEMLLHRAVDLGHESIVKLLVKDGMADVDARRKRDFWTPLFNCAYTGQASMAKCLIGLGADLKAIHEDGASAGEIFDASVSEEDQKKVREVLVERFKKIGTSHIYAHEAARVGNIERMSWYLEAGGDINARDGTDLTMLHIACRDGQYNAAVFLLEKGANVDAKDGKRWTPLYVSAMNGQLDMVKLLLSHGATANTCTNDRRTPLHGACRFGHYDVVMALLDSYELVDVKDGNENTPLHWACECGHYNVVRELLNRGAHIDLRDGNDLCAIHWACLAQESKPDIIKELATRGADLESLTRDRRTPLHLAAEKGHVGVIRELVVRGADMNAVDVQGNTPIHVAAMVGQEGAIFELLDRGCSPNVLNEEGKSPGEVVGAGLAPGHVTEETASRIKKMIRDGPRGKKKGSTTESEIRCMCVVT